MSIPNYWSKKQRLVHILSTCIVLSWYPHKAFNLRSFSVLPSCRSFLMDMAESNQTLLLMVLEYGDQVWSMISFCFLFFCFCFCFCFFFKSKQWAQFPLISHVRIYSFPIRDILSFHRRNRDSLPEHWLAIILSLPCRRSFGSSRNPPQRTTFVGQ